MTTLSQRDQCAIWHPFTQHQVSPLPLPMVRGAGAYLFDQAGNRYLDLVSSWWVNIHGHAHPAIAEAIYKQALQLEHVIFAGFTHEPAVLLAEKLLQLLPTGFTKVFYSDNGSTAVEAALKMAYQFWRNRGEKNRHRFLAFSGGYHGDTFGAMSVGGASTFFQHFTDLMFKVDFAPYPSTWENDENILQKEKAALDWLDNYFRQYREEVAAVIIEPLIQAAGGMHVCRPAFLQALEILAREHEVLVIYDEVMTGFGRTGTLFACEKAGTAPDIICLAKGLTGGFLPLAATVCHEHLYQAFLNQDVDFALAHGHSYTANPLGCAAALASLQLLTTDSTLRQLRLIEETHQQMFALLRDLPAVEALRCCGTMAAFNMVAPAAQYGSLLSQSWRQRFLERGLLIRPLGEVIYLLPPYCITMEDLRNAYQCIAEVIKNMMVEES